MNPSPPQKPDRPGNPGPPRPPWRIAGIRVWMLCVPLVAFAVLWGLEFRRTGAICQKCLQKASIRRVTLWGLPVYDRTVLWPVDRNPVRFVASDGLIPEADPASYERITGHACRHELVRGAFSATGHWPLAYMADGDYRERSLMQPRLLVTEALFRAFEKTGDVKTAAALLDAIAEAYPDVLKHPELGKAATKPFPRTYDGDGDKEIVRETDAIDSPKAAAMARQILPLWRLGLGLRTVENAGQFQAVSREFLATSPIGSAEPN